MLNLTELIGFTSGDIDVSSGVPLSITYVDSEFDGTDGTSYTYTVSVGTGDWLILGVQYQKSVSPYLIEVSSITVNGSATTLISGSTYVGKFFRIAHPGGTTATVVVNVSSTAMGGSLGVWSLTGTPSTWTPRDTTYFTGGSSTIDLYSGGVFLGIGGKVTSTPPTMTAPCPSADASEQLGADSRSGYVASCNTATTQSGATITTTANASACISLR